MKCLNNGKQSFLSPSNSISGQYNDDHIKEILILHHSQSLKQEQIKRNYGNEFYASIIYKMTLNGLRGKYTFTYGNSAGHLRRSNY